MLLGQERQASSRTSRDRQEQRAATSRSLGVREATVEDLWTTLRGSRVTAMEPEHRAVTSRGLGAAALERLEQRA
eukprot:1229949-Rhodomonas_salina.1